MKIDLFVKDEAKTFKLGEKFGNLLSSPLIIYLKGDLGAGKTHFSKGIIKGLGIDEDVTSPTFTLINEYVKNDLNIYHLDLYRLDTVNQILDLGIEDFINDNSIILIEWSEKLGEYNLSDNIIMVDIFHKKEGRTFSISSQIKTYEPILKEIKNFVDTWD